MVDRIRTGARGAGRIRSHGVMSGGTESTRKTDFTSSRRHNSTALHSGHSSTGGIGISISSGAGHVNQHHQQRRRMRRRSQRIRATGTSLAVMGVAVLLLGDVFNFSGNSGLRFLLGSREDRLVKRSLQVLDDRIQQRRLELRDTVNWKPGAVPQLSLASDRSRTWHRRRDVTVSPGYDVSALSGGESPISREDVPSANVSAKKQVVRGSAARRNQQVSEENENDNSGTSSDGTKSSAKMATDTTSTLPPPKTSNSSRQKRRMAIVRPFGPNNALELEESHRLFDTHWPCETSRERADEFQIDLYLLFSRTYDPDSYPEAVDFAERIRNKFASNNGWNGCFARLFRFEANIPPDDDLYDKSLYSGYNLDGESSSMESRSVMWVNGPNESFRKVLTVLGGLDLQAIDSIGATTTTMATTASAEDIEESGDELTSDVDSREAAPIIAAADYWDDLALQDVPGSGMLLPEIQGYELVTIMEPDVRPRRAGWLDNMLDEIHQKEPFAVMGSKYKGHAWDNFKSELPTSLLDHINGNAHYNLTHPLFLHLLSELNAEAGSAYNAIPYDYRMSQMVVEGRDGLPPEFPFQDMKDVETGEPIMLPAKTAKFRRWWDLYGPSNVLSSPDGRNPMKESEVIANFAATDYLEKHLPAGETEGVLVHGKGGWKEWDPREHDITLVISDWGDGLLRSILRSLNQVRHPFSEVIVMRTPPEDTPRSLFQRLAGIIRRRSDVQTVAGPRGPNTVRVRYVDRPHPDDMDICSAPVRTNWFMSTNSYHSLNSKGVDLMFTHPSGNAESSRPLIWYTPANSHYCTDYEACREVHNMAQRFNDNFDKIILDMDMLYHTRSRDGFCGALNELNEEEAEKSGRDSGKTHILSALSPISKHAPTATAYAAYLDRAGMAESIYQFSNQLLSGGKDAFTKVHREEEEAVRRRMVEEDEFAKLSTAAVDKNAQHNRRIFSDEDEQAFESTSNSDQAERLLPKKNDGGPTCALVFEKSKQCGAKGDAQNVCCDGLYCLGQQCTAPTECLGSSCINFRSRQLGGLVWSPPGWLVKS